MNELIKENLKELLGTKNIVYIITIDVSRTGDQRILKLLIQNRFNNLTDISYLVSKVLDLKYKEERGLILKGQGMNMQQYLIDKLSEFFNNEITIEYRSI